MSDKTPNPDEVICPNCIHQFRAIPVNVQADLTAAKAEIEAEHKLHVANVDYLSGKLLEKDAEIERLRDVLIGSGAWRKAPCCICGYNGSDYFNQKTHSCALLAAARKS
jgi:hypothetical protein